MKILVWKKDGKPHFEGQTFEVFWVRWDKRLKAWYESDRPSLRWGLKHPVTGKIVALRHPPERYGRVMDIEHIETDIETKVEVGTPTLGVVENDEEE